MAQRMLGAGFEVSLLVDRLLAVVALRNRITLSAVEGKAEKCLYRCQRCKADLAICPN